MYVIDFSIREYEMCLLNELYDDLKLGRVPTYF